MKENDENNTGSYFNSPSLTPQLAVHILSVLSDQGIDRQWALHGTGLKVSDLIDEGVFLSFRQMIMLVERAIGLTKKEWLGLEIGASENISTMGVLGYAMMSSASEREATKLGLKFQAAAATTLRICAREEENSIRFDLDSIVPLGSSLRFFVEETISGMCAISSQCLNDPVKPLGINFTFSEPSYSEKYREYFDCPIVYDQPRNTFWTRLSSDGPLRNSDPVSAKTCAALAESIVNRYSWERDFILRVRKVIINSPGNFPNMEEVAEELSMSARSLRRKLRVYDVKFSDITDGVRKNLAIDYLQNSSMSIEEISSILGYAESTGFRRAFKRWTGVSPSFIRNDTDG